ncbi:DUF1404 domain-containing protein [Sulfolobus tengchongensis]|uniref:DUF1404 domain-containing protein n=1 Tax=Sulfolobus tengchongensis TaxID=207809 RepID=A0AAX4KXJ3_9CREN
MKYYYFFILTLSLFLIAITVNPFTEEYMFVNPIPYMLAHYSLFGAGILISYYTLSKKNFPLNKNISLTIGVLIAFIWHYPLFFNLGAESLFIRIIEEITLFIGGILIGFSLKEITRNMKVLLLALWMIGDSILSLILMVSPNLYTTVYSVKELEYLGIIMFLMMNLIAVYILLNYINKMLSEEKDIVNEDYQRNPYSKNKNYV